MINLTKHAQVRCQQRGVTPELVNLVYHHADRERECGGGCIAIEVSAALSQRLNSKVGSYSDRLQNLILILSNDGVVVSVIRAHNRVAARRYRRGLQ